MATKRRRVVPRVRHTRLGKVRDLLPEAMTLVRGECEAARLEQLQEKLLELESARAVVDRLESQLEEFLDQPIRDAAFIV